VKADPNDTSGEAPGPRPAVGPGGALGRSHFVVQDGQEHVAADREHS